MSRRDGRSAGSRPSRRAVAVGLVASVVVGAIVLRRDDASTARTVEMVRAAPGASPAAPAPATTDPGPSGIEHGVPAGFARTKAGAVVAAAAFVCTGQELVDMDLLEVEAAVRQMATTGAADAQVRDTIDRLAAARQVLQGGTGPIIFRQASIAWRVESYTPERARVAVWNVGVLARDRVAPPQAGWFTSTFDLVWERGDWKIDAEVVVPGPAPMLSDAAPPATFEQFTGALDGFVDVGAAA